MRRRHALPVSAFLVATLVPGLALAASRAAVVSAGSSHTCAVTAGGGVMCWGRNHYGQLGDGTTTDRTTPTVVSGLASGAAGVAAGADHSCALMTGGGVKCWGDNANGQLGDGTTSSRATPADVSGLASGVAAVAAGGNNTCALTTAGGVKCWGDNWSGQLGDGTYEDRSVPVDVSGLAGGVTGLVVGLHHTCALTTAGAVKCWGRNSGGQLGDGTRSGSTTPRDVTGLPGGATSVAAGGDHSCALMTAGGGVECWGSNQRGQLGVATMAPRLTPTRALRFGQIDFDNDDVADLAVYRSSSGTWFSLDSSTGNSSYRQRGWGVRAQGDTPVVGDFDGDGVADPTVYRSTTGTWFVLESHTQFSAWRWFGWGNFTDTRMPGDYDGDGRTDAAVYRPSTGQWFVLPSSADFLTGWSPVTFGDPAKSDAPVAGDFDGDGKHDPAVYRPSTGTWFWLKSSANFTEYGYLGWGVQAQGDTPVPADYDGDGRTDPTVYRAAYGTWFVLKSSTNYTQYVTHGWGLPGDKPVPGDFDADGQADVAVYRPSTGEWFVRPSGGATPWTVVFGKVSDTPLVAP